MSERIDKLLQPHRDEIRELDEQIATLLIKRHIITDEIGRIKREHGVPSFQPQQKAARSVCRYRQTYRCPANGP